MALYTHAIRSSLGCRPHIRGGWSGGVRLDHVAHVPLHDVCLWSAVIIHVPVVILLVAECPWVFTRNSLPKILIPPALVRLVGLHPGELAHADRVALETLQLVRLLNTEHDQEQEQHLPLDLGQSQIGCLG